MLSRGIFYFGLWALIFPNVLLGSEDLFLNQVAPILRTRCLPCHNDQDRDGDFSIQTRATAFADGYIKPFNADSSHLVELISDGEMAPAMPKNAEPLSEREVNTIKKWINQGARWPAQFELKQKRQADFDWWSFKKITRPSVPKLDSQWPRNPIDAFILRRLKRQKLSYSKPTDRRTLIRRVTYDLTGLPPTPNEVSQFLKDDSADAYEKLVDRLLGSPRYGEHWARHWLDVVKYADTCGYDKDKLRPNAWPYRDYVIRSLNEDKPYSRFVQEQIAGDVLFPGEPDGVLGLGFIAAGPWDFIGHVEVPESKADGKVARNLDRDDMVSNTINTFCSMTIQCARCHDHKFDPFTQRHYYSLQSVFAAVDRADRVYASDPKTDRQRQQLLDQINLTTSELRKITQAIQKQGGKQLERLQRELSQLADSDAVLKGPEFGYHSQIAQAADQHKWIQLEFSKPVPISKITLFPCHDDFNQIGAGFGFPKRFKIEIAQLDAPQPTWQTVVDRTDEDQPHPGLKPLELEFPTLKTQTIRITATRLAERKNDFIFALAEVQLLDSKTPETNLASQAKISALDSIEASPRWSKSNLVDGKWARYKNESAARQLTQSRRDHAKLMENLVTPAIKKRRVALEKRLVEYQARRTRLPKGKMVYAAATEFPVQGQFKPTRGKARPIRILKRGDIGRPGDEVDPGVLPLSANQPFALDSELAEAQRRAELAKWLTRPDHPLVWRSIVNRVWQYHFGRGLVASPNDFGRMGERPTYPELLDWLASEFQQSGQSLKTLHRLIVTSNVYRQSSTFDESNARVDQSNRFLWRMPRRRLSAEEIRDSILLASNSLNLQMGGPGFYAFELERTEHSPHFEYHKFDPADSKSHRRSIYRFIVRSQPDPWMSVLDCADSSQSTPKRNETLTSLQALSLLNSKFNLVMAKRFAQQLEQHSANRTEQIQLAYQRLLQRDATVKELDLLSAYVEKHGLPNMCRILFNLSEFMYVD